MPERRMIVNESRPYSFDQELRVILSFPEGREALKALLTGDGPVLEAKATLLRLTHHGPHPGEVKAALAAAVDALDSSEEEESRG